MNDEPSPRRRGLRLLLVALILIIGVLALLAALRPEQGAYETWTQVIVHVLWLFACMSFGVGGFHTVVGAPGEGIFKLVRVPVALAFGLASIGVLAVGGFVLHASMVYEGPRSSADGSSDWDWD